MIRFTGYGVIAEKPRVGHLSRFFLVHPVGTTICVGSKNDWHLLEWSRRPLPPCKDWGDRTTRAGCRCEKWCLYVYYREDAVLLRSRKSGFCTLWEKLCVGSNKKLSWCWQTHATRLEVSHGDQTW